MGEKMEDKIFKATTHLSQNEGLIFEKSSPGKKGYRLAPLDVPDVDAGKELGGLQLIVADTNTNTVGGISANTNAFWKNYVADCSSATVLGASATSTNIQHAMNLTWIGTIRGADKPDIITADSAFYLSYLESLTPNQRFTDDKGAGVGFTNLVYQSNVPVIYDDQCPTHHMYFLNTDYLFLRPAKGREFVPLGEKSSVNQDAMVMPVVWAGNMTCSNRARQGVIIE